MSYTGLTYSSLLGREACAFRCILDSCPRTVLNRCGHVIERPWCGIGVTNTANPIAGSSFLTKVQGRPNYELRQGFQNPYRGLVSQGLPLP